MGAPGIPASISPAGIFGDPDVLLLTPDMTLSAGMVESLRHTQSINPQKT
jgi:hypothetical protein